MVLLAFVSFIPHCILCLSFSRSHYPDKLNKPLQCRKARAGRTSLQCSPGKSKQTLRRFLLALSAHFNWGEKSRGDWRLGAGQQRPEPASAAGDGWAERLRFQGAERPSCWAAGSWTGESQERGAGSGLRGAAEPLTTLQGPDSPPASILACLFFLEGLIYSFVS